MPPKEGSQYQYVIRRVTGDLVRLDLSKTFAFAANLDDATLFTTATAAEAAIAYRNEKMAALWAGYRAAYIVIPVKVTTTTTLVSEEVITYVDMPVTTTTRELA